MEYHNQKQKLVWQMTGEELVKLFQAASVSNHNHNSNKKTNTMEHKYVYGLKRIAKLFGCSVSSARRLKKSGKIDDAIIQDGRKPKISV